MDVPSKFNNNYSRCLMAKNNYKILSIDGGGIKGIIPACFLKEFVKETGKEINEYFDHVVGTSAGSIIASALLIPNAEGGAKYSASDVCSIFLDAKDWCQTSEEHKLESHDGLVAPKYETNNIYNVVKEIATDSKLSETLKPLSVLSYSLNNSAPHIWSTYSAKNDPNKDFYVKDAVEASIAYPTAFAPKKTVGPDGKIYYDVDGGVYAKNPALFTVTDFLKHNNSFSASDLQILSLGTGKEKTSNIMDKMSGYGEVDWKTKQHLFLSLVLQATSSASEIEASEIFPHYHRLNPDLPASLSNMCNESSDNKEALLKLSEDYFTQIRDQVRSIVKEMDGHEAHDNFNTEL